MASCGQAATVATVKGGDVVTTRQTDGQSIKTISGATALIEACRGKVTAEITAGAPDAGAGYQQWVAATIAKVESDLAAAGIRGPTCRWAATAGSWCAAWIYCGTC